MPNQNFDFRQIIQMIKSGKNPQQVVLEFLDSRFSSSPMGANLISLAKQNRTADIERIARNIVAERGGDFDKEFTAFKQRWGFE